jgi:hypothetical protein
MGTAEGPETGTDRSLPARHGGGYPPGWRVRYHGSRPRSSQERIGTVAGPSLRDEHTGITWVPVRPFRATPQTPVRLVRATDILDARPPDQPLPAKAEDLPRTVVVELPVRRPGGDPAR